MKKAQKTMQKSHAALIANACSSLGWPYKKSKSAMRPRLETWAGTNLKDTLGTHHIVPGTVADIYICIKPIMRMHHALTSSVFV